MRTLRAKIKANDPSALKRAAEYQKNKYKERKEQKKALLAGD